MRTVAWPDRDTHEGRSILRARSRSGQAMVCVRAELKREQLVHRGREAAESRVRGSSRVRTSGAAVNVRAVDEVAIHFWRPSLPSRWWGTARAAGRSRERRCVAHSPSAPWPGLLTAGCGGKSLGKPRSATATGGNAAQIRVSSQPPVRGCDASVTGPLGPGWRSSPLTVHVGAVAFPSIRSYRSAPRNDFQTARSGPPRQYRRRSQSRAQLPR